MNKLDKFRLFMDEPYGGTGMRGMARQALGRAWWLALLLAAASMGGAAEDVAEALAAAGTVPVWGTAGDAPTDAELAAAVRERVAAGQKAFAERDFETARDRFFEALWDAPESLEVRFWLARASAEAGDHEYAASMYELMLGERPDLDRAKLELARARLQMGEYGPAVRHFRDVASKDTTPDGVKASVLRVLDRLPGEPMSVDRVASRRGDGAATPARPALRGFVAVGGGFDSNPYSNPHNSTIDTVLVPFRLLSERDPQWYLSEYAVLDLDVGLGRLRQESPWRLKAGLMAQHLLYETARDLDFLYVGGRLGLGWERDRFKTALAFTEAVATQGRRKAYEATGGAWTTQSVLAPNFLLESAVRGEYRSYNTNPGRDGHYLDLEVSPVLALGRRNLLRMRVAGEWGSARYATQSYKRFRLGLEYTRLLLPSLRATVGGRWQATSYGEREWLFPERRYEDQFDLYAGVAKTWRRWTLDVGYTYSRVNSSVDLYGYTRHGVRTGLGPGQSHLMCSYAE